MAIVFVGDSEVTVADATSITVPAPAGLATNDLLVLVLTHGFNWLNQQLPVGWSGPHAMVIDNGSTTILTRIASASDTNWTFNFSSTQSGAAWLGAYRNARLLGASVQNNTASLSPVAQNRSVPPGVCIDILRTRRNSATAAVHASPGWATLRAYLDGTNSSRHIELSVAEHQTVAWTVDNNTWSVTNVGSSDDHIAKVTLRETSLTGGLDTNLGAAATGPGTRSAWIYKGRASSLDDAIGVA